MFTIIINTHSGIQIYKMKMNLIIKLNSLLPIIVYLAVNFSSTINLELIFNSFRLLIIDYYI